MTKEEKGLIKKIGAETILTFIFLGLLGWFAKILSEDISNLKAQVYVHKEKIVKQKKGISRVLNVVCALAIDMGTEDAKRYCKREE